MPYVEREGNKSAKTCWQSVVERVNNFRNTPGCAFVSVNHVTAQVRSLLVRCETVFEGPQGTENVWVIWSRSSHSNTPTDQSGLETKACSVLFLRRHECEEFPGNVLHLGLWCTVAPNSVLDVLVELFLRVSLYIIWHTVHCTIGLEVHWKVCYFMMLV